MNFAASTTPDRIRRSFSALNRRFAGFTVLLLSLALPTSGQTLGLGTSKNAAPAPPQAEPDPFGRSTPRGTIDGFIRATQRNDFVAAARYLEISDKQRAKTDELVRDLREVMDRYYNEPLAMISDAPSGNLDDGLPIDQERVPLRTQGEPVDIILKRVKNPQTGLIWLISSDTLAQVPALSEAIEQTWVEQTMPQVLLEHNFLGASLALWVAWLASLALPLLLFWSLSRLGILLLRKTVDESRRLRLTTLAWPFTVVLTITVHLSLLPWLGLPLGFRILYTRACYVLLVIAIAWLLHRIFRLSFERARSLMERRRRSDTESLMLLGQRVFNVLLTLVTIFVVLSILGIDTKTALAGVGIGGVAIAFGAQKTVENLLGGIFLLSDKALAVGDTCCISSRLGTVEDITLRSVRLRTPEQTLLSIPAGALSQANIENFATRQKILAQTSLQLRYGTTTEQLRSVLEGIRTLLKENLKIETNTARVRLVNFGARAIELELYAYILTADNTEFLSVREELLLHIVEVVEASGTAFAMPTEFIYAEQMVDGRRGALSTAGEVEQPEKVTSERSRAMMKRAI